MGWLAALGSIGGSLLNGVLGNESADRAADAQVAASDRAQETQRYMFDESVRLSEPFRQAGMGALNQRNALLGLPQVSDGMGGGAGSGAINPATGRPYQGPNWSQYVAQNPDVLAYWNNNPSVRNTFPTIEALAQHHYNSFGQGEGRELPQYGAGGGGAGGTPSTVGIGGGAAQPTVGGGDQLAVMGGAGQADPVRSAQDAAYDTFLNSGQARSMLETTNSDFDRMIGAFGAGGTAMSGATLGALNDRNRRNTNVAFNQYDNALAGISNTGQATATQQGQNALTTGNNLANAESFQGAVRGSSYAGRTNPLSSILGGAAGADWSFLGRGGSGGSGGSGGGSY